MLRTKQWWENKHEDFKIHHLKIEPQYFQEVFNRNKRFEVRINDRDFQVGDFVILEEHDDIGYTGNYILIEITYILNDPKYCKEPYIIFSFRVRYECVGERIKK